MLVVVVGGAVALVRSSALDVDAVEVTGVTTERAEAARAASGLAVGDPILTFWPGRVRTRVRALPWVADATVVRRLPGTVRIEVTPRTPVGWVRAGARVLLVDGEARVIERVDAAPPGVPELVGLEARAPVGGEVAPRSLAAAAAGLGLALRQRVGTVTLEDGVVSAQVLGGPQLRFGPPERMGAKARVASAVLATPGTTGATYVDVSVPAAPVSG
ncbi:MAG: cell division protein FtsQ/DivIB [Actinomycetota bacterium]